MGVDERGRLIGHEARETVAIEGGAVGHAHQDGGPARSGARSSRAVGQWMWRTNPQMWQVAVPVSGSRSSRLAQPLVPQKRRLLEVAAKVRRRMRRTAEARPVTDAWVERDIMVLCSCAFWRALIAA